MTDDSYALDTLSKFSEWNIHNVPNWITREPTSSESSSPKEVRSEVENQDKPHPESDGYPQGYLFGKLLPIHDPKSDKYNPSLDDKDCPEWAKTYAYTWMINNLAEYGELQSAAEYFLYTMEKENCSSDKILAVMSMFLELFESID